MKWKAASAKYRQDIARALVAATPPLVIGRPPASAVELRSAMNNWGFKRSAAPMPRRTWPSVSGGSP